MTSDGLFDARYDTTATAMRGYGFYTRLAKTSGLWLWETAQNWRSPGFEVNDMSFLSRADYKWMVANVARQYSKPMGPWQNVFEGGTPEQESEFRLTVPRLVLELFLRSRDRNLVLHYVGGVDVPLARSRNFEVEFPTFGLTSDAESVVRLIDGSSTAAEIAAEAPADSFAVEKLPRQHLHQ